MSEKQGSQKGAVLVVCEKELAAKRIAGILSGGKAKQQSSHSVPFYSFEMDGRPYIVIGLKGHIFQLDFPPEFNDWSKVDPLDLVGQKLIKVPIQKNVLEALRSLSRDVSTVIIATDFDREGEVIGVDAELYLKEIKPSLEVKRARFSSITEDEIKAAFRQLEEPYYDLAEAGNARQEIDLSWGASLTRFISLASRRLGDKFLSVGRVQSPTLALIVQREMEIRNFESTPYWQVKLVLEADGQLFEVFHKKSRFDSEAEAREVLALAGSTGKVVLVKRSQKEKKPPAPMNTTALLANASRLGLSAPQVMAAAEELYLRGLISYPRVDNTVYPPSIDLVKVLRGLLAHPEYAGLASELLEKGMTTPTRGARVSTDHPPIHPTGEVPAEELSGAQGKVFDFVVRMFLASFAPASVRESVRIEFDVSGEIFVFQGGHTVFNGWLKFAPMFSPKNDLIPRLSEGDEVRVVDKEVVAKQTQPPDRYSQGRLVEKMEELGLGTKSTRAAIIKNLYDRGYVVGDPVKPTEMGIAVSNVLAKYAPRISSPEMTAELERDMDLISEGNLSKEEVIAVSQRFLTEVLTSMKGSESRISEEIRNGIVEDKKIGICPACGSDLMLMRSRKSRKRFVGCKNYPACSNSYPVPQSGVIRSTGKVCDVCGAPKVLVVRRARRPWELCLNPSCPTKGSQAAIEEEELEPAGSSEKATHP